MPHLVYSGPVAGLEPWVHALAIPGTNMLGHAFPPLTILGMKVPVAEWYDGRRRNLVTSYSIEIKSVEICLCQSEGKVGGGSSLSCRSMVANSALVPELMSLSIRPALPLVLGLGLFCTCGHEFPMAIL